MNMKVPIMITGIIATLLGITMAYFERHMDDPNLKFIPLVVGFIFVFIFFLCIEKKGNDKYGKIKE